MPHAQFPDDLWQRNDLSSTAKLVAEVLERNTARRYQHSFLSSEGLGRLVGRSERTAQLALAELMRVGLVAVKRCRRWLGRVIQSGHMISLLWRSRPPFFGATDCASPAQPVAPESVPPTPPIVVSEDVSKREADGDSAPVPPPPQPSSEHAGDGLGGATREEIGEAVARATVVLRMDEHSARARVVTFARRWGLSWVVAALGRAEAKQAVEPLRNPAGYVVRTLEGFRAEGGPPPLPPPRLSDEEFLARLERVEAEREAYIAAQRAAHFAAAT